MHTWATLMQNSTFVALFQNEASREANSPIRSGYLGTILRCRIYVSSNSREYTDEGDSGTTDVYSMLFIGKESYGMAGFSTMPEFDKEGGEYSNNTGKRVKPVEIIVKQLGSAGADDPLNQRATVGWKMSLATSVLNSAWIRDLEHSNAFSDI